MGKAHRNSNLGISTKEISIKGSQMAMESTSGQMAASTKDISKMALERETESGKNHQETAIDTKATTSETRSKGMAFLAGRQVISTKDTTSKI